MPLHLLSTKLHIPRVRDNAVLRPRLIKILLAGVKHPRSLTLLSGPAGFGKTTLLGRFAADLERPVAWVSLDESDNDPIRFWTYLIAASQSIHAEIGESASALLQSPQPLPDETIPTLLINDLVRLGIDLIIILDDYHAIQNRGIHSALDFLLDHLPENLHIVISTRVDPPWPLARLRARDQLIEIRAADLRFTLDETAVFLNEVMDLNLSAENVAALESRTEGWIASLQLAAISMTGRTDLTDFITTFTGSHVYVAEYLMEEVLARQPEEVKDFLLRTSVLERLNASLCGFVTGHAESQAVLKAIYQSNLFLVPLDDEGHWFRYHHLFGDLLRVRLSQTVSMDDITGLHRRAMTWFEKNALVNDAIHHAFAARDFYAAARLVDQNAFQVMIRGELTTLLGWIDALPGEVLQIHPSLLIKKAWVLTLTGAVRQVEPLLQQAEARIETNDTSPSARELLGNAAAMRGFFAMMRGEYPRALEFAKRADDLLPASDVHISWLVPYTLGSAHRSQGDYEQAVEAFERQAQMAEKYDNLILWATGITEVAIVRRLQGRLREAASTCLQALQTIGERGASQFGSLAKLEVPLIEVLREQNELEEAYRRVMDVIARMQNWPMPTDRIFAYLAQIHVQAAIGDLDGAFKVLDRAKELKAKNPVLANLARSVDLSEIRLCLASGETTTAARLLEALQPGTSLTVSLREQELVLLARVHVAQNKLEEAEQILSSLAAGAEAGGRNNALVEILALLARSWRAKGDQEKALMILSKALSLAEPEKFMRTFIDEGAAMHQLLHALSGTLAVTTDEPSVRLRDYAARLLTAFPHANTPGLPSFSVVDKSGLIDPLTPRELEVLRLIADGNSNQAIAEKLFITVSAVKKHTGNIFGKLSVNSRTQAVAWARQLGLLAP
jgi:LuxR family maltose regulon positive regulatory protein